ncbi:hypothetical protein C9374_007736 [Naegleria lovaniensis]|uniref:CS domain-containing protein n=1 Tax=Naegleria lovaniensis TaxID=51637 RepID=A0AA88GI99_NAELO|nr:uncharacterized protein C9374_007736 [Naegleria lovaniensis]KAG2379098.1 hypothetical protein C9374_007736 [Naegleria lovaniensis]
MSEEQANTFKFKEGANGRTIIIELNSPEGLVQEDVDVALEKKRITVVVRKPEEPEQTLLEGELLHEVDPASLDWKLASDVITIEVKKANPETKWASLFVIVIEIPHLFKLTDDNKVNEIIKILKETKKREDGEEGETGDGDDTKPLTSQELLSMKHPIHRYSLMGWATMNRKYPIVEYLLRAYGPKRVANLPNEQDLEILKEWQKEKRRLTALSKKKNNPNENLDEEDENAEEKDFASSLLEKFEKYNIEIIKQIGEFGIYEGDTSDFEIPVELPPITEEASQNDVPEPKENAQSQEKDMENEEKQNEEGQEENSEEAQEEGEENDTENNEGQEDKEEAETQQEPEKPQKPKVIEPPKPQFVKYRNGFGSAYYTNDDVYIGVFKDTIREGMGAYIYRGDYIENLRKEKEKQQEDLEADEAEEEDESLNPENIPLCYFVGDWKDGKKNGKGRMLYHNGDRFYGEFVNDMKHCERGIYLYSNGDMFVGQFQNDVKEGNGVYTFAADGSSLDGTWKSGKFVEGTWNWKDGKIAFKSSDFTSKTVQGNFVFQNFKASGSFVDQKWHLSQITL